MIGYTGNNHFFAGKERDYTQVGNILFDDSGAWLYDDSGSPLYAV